MSVNSLQMLGGEVMKFVGVLVGVICVATAGTASAGPVIRAATGANAAAIQAAVDQFRNDLGPDNGLVVGSQTGGRREINWDGGGPAAPPTIDGNVLTRFAGRGATFVTTGAGFETSAAAGPVDFSDINPTYPGLFAAFSPPRLFVARNTNEMDAIFNVPGSTAIPAGVTGFGAVFTDVDSPTSTRLQFFAPDGALLFERAVPATNGNETLSFLGVSFDKGEIIGRVRIISGNAALGPDEAGTLDLVAMDDFIYGEPVAFEGLTIAPASGAVFRVGSFDLTIGIDAGTALVSARVLFDGVEVTEGLASCFAPGLLKRGGPVFSCQVPRPLLTEGEHVVQVVVTLADQTTRRNAVRWTVLCDSR
jgi:hypothetical protein